MLTQYAMTWHNNLDSQRFAGMLSTEREFQRVHIPIRIKTRIPERGFFLLFFKKKRRQGECRTFAFSVIPPTSLTYTFIIIGQKPISTKSGQFKKWHNAQFLFLKFMLIIGYKQLTPFNYV